MRARVCPVVCSTTARRFTRALVGPLRHLRQRERIQWHAQLYAPPQGPHILSIERVGVDVWISSQARAIERQRNWFTEKERLPYNMRMFSMDVQSRQDSARFRVSTQSASFCRKRPIKAHDELELRRCFILTTMSLAPGWHCSPCSYR